MKTEISRKIKIAIYNENCLQSGRRAFESSGFVGSWPADDEDVHVEEGTFDELNARALALWNNKAPAGNDLYQRRCAKTIADEIGIELP